MRGRVRVGGAKNSALPILAATLLTDEPLRIGNLPEVVDVRTMQKLLAGLGTVLEPEGRTAVTLTTPQPGLEASYDLVRRMRASVLVLGPLLARTGRARVSLPGGCAIGARPIDLHLEALRRMGADIDIRHGYVEATCARLRGADITFGGVTVGGTENLLMAACLAEGRTVLRCCAREPEIVDLARLLRKMGADIQGDGTDTIEIRGVDALGGARHDVIPDRVEAGTYIVAGALAGDDVTVEGCEPAHLGALLDAVRAAGAGVDVSGQAVRVRPPARGLRACDIRTAPFPGFPTDMQAQFMALLTQAEGSGRIVEEIFEARFMHALELRRMGARIRIDGATAHVSGPTPLSGAEVIASDLRASACLVLASLVAKGTTIVHRVYHLDRGYERIEEKLRGLGAAVTRERE